MNKKPKKITCCGLGGGGFYGFAEVAFFKEIENYKEYFDIQNISGVSVGSMVAALYAVGYTADELEKIMFDFDFDKLIRDSMFPYIKLYDSYGMYQACPLEEEIERLIRVKKNTKFCTFSQVKMNLTVIATNLNMQCPRYFNRETTPEFPISRAVRMSISYPLVMAPILFEGDYYGDGGIYMNYPIIMFENKLDETIGVTFSAHNENRDGTLNKRVPINDVYDYIRSLGITMSRAAYVSQIRPQFLDRSIVIKIEQNINCMQFNLTREQKKYIYDCGAKSTREQIEKLLGLSQEIIHEADLVKPQFPANPNSELDNMVKYIMNADPKLLDSIVSNK